MNFSYSEASCNNIYSVLDNSIYMDVGKREVWLERTRIWLDLLLPAKSACHLPHFFLQLPKQSPFLVLYHERSLAKENATFLLRFQFHSWARNEHGADSTLRKARQAWQVGEPRHLFCIPATSHDLFTFYYNHQLNVGFKSWWGRYRFQPLTSPKD